MSNGRFLHALNFCMLLPGPEAQQLAIYLGWLLHKVRGGLVAGVMFVLPSFFVLLALSWVYVAHGDVTWVSATLAGLAPAVIAIVASATIRIGQKALANGLMVAVAVAAFVAIYVVHVPFPVIVLVAGAIGLVGGSAWPDLFRRRGGRGTGGARARSRSRDDAPAGRAHEADGGPDAGDARWWGWSCGWCRSRWSLPGAGPATRSREMGWFFSRASLVTFGGAYAVLAYVNVAAVSTYGWLLPGQMVVGLGLAETTPGPLIMVLEFVGFVGAYQHPGDLDPLVAGVLGACVVVWATFAPCFLWIFLGAPYIEGLRGNRRLGAALETITAAVVGVIANLAVTFALSTLFERGSGVARARAVRRGAAGVVERGPVRGRGGPGGVRRDVAVPMEGDPGGGGIGAGRVALVTACSGTDAIRPARARMFSRT